MSKKIRIVENGKVKELADEGIKKVKLDRLLNSRELNKIIEEKRQ